MPTFHVNIEQGEAAIFAALATAKPGDKVALDAGEWRITQTIVLPSGIEFCGAGPDQTVLVSDLDVPSVQAIDAENVVICDFAIRHIGVDTPYRVMPGDAPISVDEVPDDAPSIAWGVVWIKFCRSVELSNLALEGRRENIAAGGLYVSESEGVSIRACRSEKWGQCSIQLARSTAHQIEDCTASDSSRGIFLGDRSSSALITNNRCHDNKGAGIVLFSSESEGIIGNECWGNGLSGILLERGENALMGPSRALIANNRCHDNKEAGVLLLSSESENISGNECWGNGRAGIVLQRDKDALMEPSRALITNNRCHDNQQSGLVLFSSESENISGNECWGNGLSGIMLQRDEDAPTEASRALITNNRCHDNQQSGLVLFSSESDDIRGNECWGNHRSGILLARDEASPTEPSRAKITSNHCYQNKEGGVVIASSESEDISGNECWRNGLSGIGLTRNIIFRGEPSRALIKSNRCHENLTAFYLTVGTQAAFCDNFAWENNEKSSWLDIDGKILHPLNENFIDPSESKAETSAHIRKWMLGGFLASELEERSVHLPDELARFVCGSGSLTDFKLWMEQDGQNPDQTDLDSSSAVPATSWNLDKETLANNSATFSPERDDLTRYVWKETEKNVWDNVANPFLLGTFGEDEGELDQMLADISVANNFEFSTHDPDGKVPTGNAGILRGLQQRGKRFGSPLDFDYLPRSEAALSRNVVTRDLFATSEQTLWQRLGERLSLVISSWRFWARLCGLLAMYALFFVGIGWFKGFEHPLFDPFGAIQFALVENFESLQILDFVAFPAIGVTLFSWLFWLVNREFPSHLSIRLPRWIERFTESRLGEIIEQIQDQAWLRWASRKLFSGDVCFLVIRNVSEWLEGDLSALSELVSRRKPNQSLFIIINSPTRTLLDRVLLPPAIKFEENDMGCGSIRAWFGKEPGALNLNSATRGEKAGLHTLGLKGEINSSEAEEEIAGIRLPDFSLADLIPMLCVGSTHLSPFTLRMPVYRSAQRLQQEFSKSLEEYSQLYDGDSELNSSSLDARLTALVGRMKGSPAVMVASESIGQVDYYRLLGRSALRDGLVEDLSQIFGGRNVQFHRYLDRLMQCGQLRLVNQINELAIEFKSEPAQAVGIFKALRSLSLLRSESEALSMHLQHEGAQESEISKSLKTKIHGALQNVFELSLMGDNEVTKNVFSRIGAELLSALSLEFEVLSSAKQGTPIAVVSEVLQDCLSEFEHLDRDLAMKRSLHTLKPIFSSIGKDRSAQIKEMLDGRFTGGRSLADLLSEAERPEAILNIMHRHEEMADDAIATLLSMIARAANSPTDQLLVANELADRRGDFMKHATVGQSRSYCRFREESLDALLWTLKQIDLEKFFKRSNFEGATELDLMFGSTGSLWDTQSEVAHIEFGGFETGIGGLGQDEIAQLSAISDPSAMPSLET